MVFDYAEYDLTGLIEAQRYRFTVPQVRMPHSVSVVLGACTHHAVHSPAICLTCKSFFAHGYNRNSLFNYVAWCMLISCWLLPRVSTPGDVCDVA